MKIVKKFLFSKRKRKWRGRPLISLVWTPEYREVIWNRKSTRSPSRFLFFYLASRVHFLCIRSNHTICFIRNFNIKIKCGPLLYNKDKNPNLVVRSMRKLLTAWVVMWHSSAVLIVNSNYFRSFLYFSTSVKYTFTACLIKSWIFISFSCAFWSQNSYWESCSVRFTRLLISTSFLLLFTSAVSYTYFTSFISDLEFILIFRFLVLNANKYAWIATRVTSDNDFPFSSAKRWSSFFSALEILIKICSRGILAIASSL